QGGRMVVARAFKGARGVEVRTGSLEFPDEATFSARYPTILAAKELEIRDKEEVAQFEAEVGKVVELAGSPATVPQAVVALVRAVNAHAPALKRSAPLRAALTRRDEALAPVLKEIGKTKAAATKGKIAALDLNGLIQRAETRAFADLAAEGSVQVGAVSRASRVDTTALLPRAMAGYGEALKGVKPRKLATNVTRAASESGLGAAQACGAAEKKLQESKLALINCNFGLERCD